MTSRCDPFTSEWMSTAKCDTKVAVTRVPPATSVNANAAFSRGVAFSTQDAAEFLKGSEKLLFYTGSGKFEEKKNL